MAAHKFQETRAYNIATHMLHGFKYDISVVFDGHGVGCTFIAMNNLLILILFVLLKHFSSTGLKHVREVSAC